MGLTQPMYQLSRMKRNSATESPTRTASARAMWLLRFPLSRPRRIMNTPALAKAPSTATNINTITIFMRPIIRGGGISRAEAA